MQNRWGPTRVGPFGLLQPAADGIKFLFKEDLTPPHVYKPLYIAAPLIAVIFALTSIAVIPFGNSVMIWGYSFPLQVTDVNTGLLLILGVTSIGVYGVALAGWSSNNKYSLLGGLRASAQMVSYEISLGLSLVGVLIMAGSFSLRDIVVAQSGHFWGFIPRWNIFHGQFIGFFCYLMAAYAETNRIPFDLPEAETELVAGYHTEYSAMKFAMFFMAEYANMITVACLATLLFFGGWNGPLFGPPILQAVLPLFWFAAKIFGFLFLYIWVRGTLPLRPVDVVWLEILAAAIVDESDRDRNRSGLVRGGTQYSVPGTQLERTPRRVPSSEFLSTEYWVLSAYLMNVHLILFLAFGAVCVAGAINLLAQTHPINSALSLIAVMAALAGEYLLLGAEFVAAVQVIVYAGAIMVLFVFTIMLLNAGVEERTKGSRVAVLFGIPGMLLGSVLVAWVFLRHSGTESVAVGALPGAPKTIGTLLFHEFLLPFEITSILILIAIMGAVVLASKPPSAPARKVD
jgi:NADH-quinone oxidoreductase subunit H